MNNKTTKLCGACRKKKSTVDFYKSSKNKDGLQVYCKKCSAQKSRYSEAQKTPEKKEAKRIYQKEYRERNKKELSEKKKEYYKKNKKRIRAYIKNWQIENREKVNAYYRQDHMKEKRKQRIKENPHRRLSDGIRSRISAKLKSKKPQKTEYYLGCSIQELKEHLESQFLPGMTWDNWGKGLNFWNLDHITPLCTATNDEEILALWHYTNLQPMWRELNQEKSGSLDWEAPEDYLPPFMREDNEEDKQR